MALSLSLSSHINTCWLKLSVRDEFSAAKDSANALDVSKARWRENFSWVKSSICCKREKEDHAIRTAYQNEFKFFI